MGVRMRYTLLYGGLFLLSGAALLAIVAVFTVQDTVSVPAGPGQVPVGEQVARLQRQLADSDRAHFRSLLYGAVVALLVMLLISLVLGRAVAGRVLRPLRTITATTRRITADNLHERLAVSGPADEVKALADTIDDLLERLELSFAAQRRFVADASHELRTPLATMRASLDVALAKPAPDAAGSVPPVLADRLRGSLDRMDELLDGFLLLARAQHGALDSRELVDLSELVTVAAKALPLAVRALAPVPARGNPVLLARMIGNVLDNAWRYAPAPGSIRIETGPTFVRVENDGPPLDPDQVRRLGEPFQRLGPGRTGTGTGLGLSIVAAIAAAHGGTLDLTARPAGGLSVTITLPPA